MDQTDSHCPHCQSKLTSVFDSRRMRYICKKCDADPFKSPKVDALLRAAELQPPKTPGGD
jgi:hypothetical protein